jgi:hypothetical protein
MLKLAHGGVPRIVDDDHVVVSIEQLRLAAEFEFSENVDIANWRHAFSPSGDEL